ncbi:MAG TPA: hypothetical protein VIO14_06615, partial [Dehalococcoidia bacterium]
MPRVSSKSRPRGAARRARLSRSAAPSPAARLLQAVFRWEALGIVIVGLSALAVPWFSILTVIAGIRDALIRLFGLGVFFLAALMAAAGVLIALRAWWAAARFWRQGLGAAALALFGWGLLGLYRPDWRIGGESLADVTAGGSVGRWLVDGPPGVLLWLALLAGGVTTVWPAQVRWFLRQVPAAAAAVVRQRLPQRGWRFLKAAALSFFPNRAPVPPAAEAAPPEPLTEPLILEGVDGEDLAPPRPAPPPAPARPAAPEPPPAPPPVAAPDAAWRLPPIELLQAAADQDAPPID